jgi:hypothetical protein
MYNRPPKVLLLLFLANVAPTEKAFIAAPVRQPNSIYRAGKFVELVWPALNYKKISM